MMIVMLHPSAASDDVTAVPATDHLREMLLTLTDRITSKSGPREKRDVAFRIPGS